MFGQEKHMKAKKHVQWRFQNLSNPRTRDQEEMMHFIIIMNKCIKIFGIILSVRRILLTK